MQELTMVMCFLVCLFHLLSLSLSLSRRSGHERGGSQPKASARTYLAQQEIRSPSFLPPPWEAATVATAPLHLTCTHLTATTHQSIPGSHPTNQLKTPLDLLPPLSWTQKKAAVLSSFRSFYEMGVWKPTLLLLLLLLLIPASRGESRGQKVVAVGRVQGPQQVFDLGPTRQPRYSAGAPLRNSERSVPHSSDPLHNR